MRNKKRFGWILAAGLLAANVLPCYGATTQEQIDAQQQKKQQTEASLESTEDRIQELESMKDESEAYLSELNRQLTDLTASLQQLQEDASQKQAELVQVQSELAEAKTRESKQMEDMTLRIQYMYERSQTGALEMLFSADGFMDFLNRANNISEITRYDREMLADYEETRQEVEEKEQLVLEEQEAIRELQEESAEKQDQVQELYEATYNQVQEYAASLNGAESEKAELLAQIQSQEDILNQLLIQAKQEEIEAQRKAEEEQRAAEEAARQAALQQAAEEQQAQQEESTPSYDVVEETPAPDSSSSESDSSQETLPPEQSSDSSDSDSSDSGNSSGGTYLGNFKLTAYCSCSICCGVWAANPGLTASGAIAQEGVTVAMAGVPFGTKLMINGHVYTVQDRGTAYGHVDIYFSSHAAALQFGMQYADVYQLN